MKIAYIILAHKAPEQLVRLISKLQTEETSFFIHIDKKTDKEIYDKIVEQLKKVSLNIYFLKRYKCYWGGFNIVKATIEGIKEIAKLKIDFDYAILLSGQDYLIKPSSYIEDFLTKNKDKEFIEFFSLSSPNKWQGQAGYYEGFKRIEYWHFRFKSRHFPLQIKRKFPQGFEPYGGGQWWCFSRKCIEYINEFLKENPAFLNYFNYVFIPDEIFFQTLILNSPFKNNVINDDLKYIDWENPNPTPPAILEKSDFQKLLNSPKLFARKFDMTRDKDILDTIDREILK